MNGAITFNGKPEWTELEPIASPGSNSAPFAAAKVRLGRRFMEDMDAPHPRDPGNLRAERLAFEFSIPRKPARGQEGGIARLAAPAGGDSLFYRLVFEDGRRTEVIRELLDARQ